jgi:hypothetical protein
MIKSGSSVARQTRASKPSQLANPPRPQLGFVSRRFRIAAAEYTAQLLEARTHIRLPGGYFIPAPASPGWKQTHLRSAH